MDILYERCCGLDVHKKTIVGCCITPTGKETKSFGTMTGDIRLLVTWLRMLNCSVVAMESTGVYWKPIYNLLELEEFDAHVINARSIKTVPGRKTDVKDAEWIAQVFRLGLVRSSFIPDRQQRENREIVRYRNSLVQERAREANRIHKILEGANIKLGAVVSDILGASSRSIIQGFIDGIEDPRFLAARAKGTLKNKRDDLERGLEGILGSHQRKMLRAQLDHVEFLDRKIEGLGEEIAERMRPFEKALDLIDTIPGIGRLTAEKIVAELGTNMERFPSADHLASWAGLCPGNNESAGVRKSGATTKGNNALRNALIEAALSVSRTKSSYLSSKYHRIAARRGKRRAAIAIAHTLLIVIYTMLKRAQPYRDLGMNHYEKQREARMVAKAVRSIESLGYEVAVKKIVA